jgi:aspartate racemase
MTLPDSLTQALKALSQQEDVSLFMTLLAAFKILLHRYTGQEDIIVGAPIANRERVEFEGLIGFLSNTLVLRTDLSGNPSFREFLSRSQEVVQGAFAHQELPFDKLIEEVNPARELKEQRLFQVEFTFQERPISVMEQSGLKWIVLPVEKQSEEYDLSLKIIDDGKQLLTTGMPARLTFEYSPDLFNQSTISRMMGHFERLLEGIVANPEHSC